MNWDRIEGNWRQLKGEELVGRVQDSYGIAENHAEEQVESFAAKCRGNQWVQ